MSPEISRWLLPLARLDLETAKGTLEDAVAWAKEIRKREKDSPGIWRCSFEEADREVREAKKRTKVAEDAVVSLRLSGFGRYGKTKASRKPR